jgi:hypothetical protein
VRRPEDLHLGAPRCLLSLHEKANGTSLDGEGIQAWLEWEMEAMRWRVPIEISRENLEALVEALEIVLGAPKVRRYEPRGGARDLAPWDERADIVLKALQMVSNERKGR